MGIYLDTFGRSRLENCSENVDFWRSLGRVASDAGGHQPSGEQAEPLGCELTDEWVSQ
jgi:hypothetical protein